MQPLGIFCYLVVCITFHVPGIAIELFAEIRIGIAPIICSVSAILILCAKLEAAKLGARVDDLSLKAGFCLNVAVKTAMSQLDGVPRFPETSKTPRTPTSPTFEQLLKGNASSWPSGASPRLGRIHDPEEDHSPHRKSVLAKVKEKAKKLRNTLSGKKNHGNALHDNNTTPSWGVSLDGGEEDEDPEFFGAPMYESELAPENYKETARQHPRADPVVSEKHVLASSVKHGVEEEKEKLPSANKTLTETVPEKLAPAYIGVSEKLAPAYAAVSDATQTIASTIAGLTIVTPTPVETGDTTGPTASVIEKLGSNSETRDQYCNSPPKWEKSVSVKEYLMHKLEPGEDERALSQVISEAISPRKTPCEVGVVEKVREAVSSFLRPEAPSHLTSKNTNSSSDISVSTNAKPLPHSSVFTTTTSSSPQIPASTSSSSLTHLPLSTNAHEGELTFHFTVNSL
ncbi:unnamed protein product [Ilex paraguariensis]|uniref:Uncharacterized protein n=1 Tax=Ilex paraguariensis TaxID=185542 RepID=A0ABC8RB46_9AQUA